MTGDGRGEQSLEDRLRALREQMESGFPARAEELRAAARQIVEGDLAARDDIRRYAHKLHGTAGSLGHTALGVQARQVEELARTSDDVRALAAAAHALATALLEAPTRRDSEPSLGRPASTSLVGQRVVAIEDDPTTGKLLDLSLRAIGRCALSRYTDVESALAAASPGGADLLVVETDRLPGTALAFAAHARNQKGLRDVPILFVSTATREALGWVLPARTLWLLKPFKSAEAIAAAARLLAGRDP